MTYRKHRGRSNAMMNVTSINLNEKKCGICGSAKTDIINKEGTLVFRRHRDPYKKNISMCGNCHRKRVYRKARLVRVRRQHLVIPI
jgi:hypothetical protein